MHKSRLNLKLLSYIPAILLMVLIYWFSAQPADASTDISISFSFHLVKCFVNLFKEHFSEQELYDLAVSIHGIIRKIAHFSEYALLSFSFHLPAYIYKKQEKKHRLLIVLICFLYACTDEIHQLFVPGRACMFRDICIDTSGAFLAMLFFWGASVLFHKYFQ